MFFRYNYPYIKTTTGTITSSHTLFPSLQNATSIRSRPLHSPRTVHRRCSRPPPASDSKGNVPLRHSTSGPCTLRNRQDPRHSCYLRWKVYIYLPSGKKTSTDVSPLLSYAGLTMARVCHDHFQKVVIVETEKWLCDEDARRVSAWEQHGSRTRIEQYQSVQGRIRLFSLPLQHALTPQCRHPFVCPKRVRVFVRRSGRSISGFRNAVST